MKSNSIGKCCIVFDTNSLYRNLDKYRNYSSFRLPSNFDKVNNCLSDYNLEDVFDIGIPAVVWKELERQTIDKYEEVKRDIKKTFKNLNMPFFELKEDEGDYPNQLKIYIQDCKNDLEKLSCNVFEIPLPDERCFNTIVDRAFEKKAPFSGEHGESDKGFKDALIWESIISLKKTNEYKKIIFFTSDKDFKIEELKEEFERDTYGVEFSIVRNIEEFDREARSIAKTIYCDELQLPEQFNLLEEVREWATTKNFRKSVNEFKLFEYVDAQFGEPIECDKRVISIESVTYDGSTIGEDVFVVNCILSIGCRFGEKAPYIHNHVEAKIRLKANKKGSL